MNNISRPLLKFGHENGDPIERRNLFCRVSGEGWSRLEVTVAKSPIGFIREILMTWSAPFAVVYELETSLDPNFPAGRYQSDWLENFEELDALLIKNWDFFEQDGRHNIWIADSQAPRQIIYDQHEIIYIYGAENTLDLTLLERGFSDEAPEIPFPHTHFYHPQFDDAFEALMKDHVWGYADE